jgi:hypothetical protein
MRLADQHNDDGKIRSREYHRRRLFLPTKRRLLRSPACRLRTDPRRFATAAQLGLLRRLAQIGAFPSVQRISSCRGLGDHIGLSAKLSLIEGERKGRGLVAFALDLGSVQTSQFKLLLSLRPMFPMPGVRAPLLLPQLVGTPTDFLLLLWDLTPYDKTSAPGEGAVEAMNAVKAATVLLWPDGSIHT